jgi:hypothetical protein
MLTEILEETEEQGEPSPVVAAKKAYQACMDTGNLSLYIPWLLFVYCVCLVLYLKNLV